MPKEVADALKKQGHWQGDDENKNRIPRPMGANKIKELR
jgi:hypothetical protein